jgi:hypothetical protein
MIVYAVLCLNLKLYTLSIDVTSDLNWTNSGVKLSYCPVIKLLKPSGINMTTCFRIYKLYILPSKFTYFCLILRTKRVLFVDNINYCYL